jgi:hypothetical protein
MLATSAAAATRPAAVAIVAVGSQVVAATLVIIGHIFTIEAQTVLLENWGISSNS